MNLMLSILVHSPAPPPLAHGAVTVPEACHGHCGEHGHASDGDNNAQPGAAHTQPPIPNLSTQSSALDALNEAPDAPNKEIGRECIEVMRARSANFSIVYLTTIMEISSRQTS